MTHTAEPGGVTDLPDDVLDRVACASLVDAMGRVHSHRAHILSFVSPAPRRLFRRTTSPSPPPRIPAMHGYDR